MGITNDLKSYHLNREGTSPIWLVSRPVNVLDQVFILNCMIILQVHLER